MSEIPKRREERKAAAAYTATAAFAATTASQTIAATTQEEKTPVYEDQIEEMERIALPSRDGSKTDESQREDDQYVAMEVVEEWPEAKKMLKARPVTPYTEVVRVDTEVCVGTSPYISMVATDLSSTSTSSSNISALLPRASASLPSTLPPPQSSP